MKSTGIVRRIDELGRIVIPKEIRKNLHIREGESVEIFLDSDNIVLKKFSIIKNINDLAQNFVDSIYSVLKNNVIITDTNNVIATNSKISKTIFGKNISDYLISLIEKRERFNEMHVKNFKITDDFSIDCSYIVNPILLNGDVIGLLIIYNEEGFFDDDFLKFVNLCTTFFENYLNI